MNNHIGEVKQFFNKTENYLHKRFGIELRKTLIDEFAREHNCFNENLLDIGCGDGSLSLPYVTSLQKLMLVDVSESMLEKAAENANSLYAQDQVKKINFVKGDFIDLKITEDFNVLFCIGVLAHVKNLDSFFQKINEVTKKNSLVFIQLSSWYHPLTMINLFLSRRGYKIKRISRRKVTAMIGKHGFERVSSKQYLFPFPGMSYFSDSKLYRFQNFMRRNKSLSFMCSDYMLVFKKYA